MQLSKEQATNKHSSQVHVKQQSTCPEYTAITETRDENSFQIIQLKNRRIILQLHAAVHVTDVVKHTLTAGFLVLLVR